MKHTFSRYVLSTCLLLPATAALAAPDAAAPSAAAADDKKKAEAAASLARDRAKMEADNKAELERLTPEIRAEVKALAEKKHASARAALKAAVAGKHRKVGNADRDKQRHPVETLTFLGLKPTMTVVEYSPGDGWYTELLAPTLAKQGKLYITNGDANGPADKRSTFYAQRTKAFLDRLPEAYGKVETVVLTEGVQELTGRDGD